MVINMEYSAKEVMNFLNINRETLRHYENMGLIHPRIDDKTHYRYYTDFDIETIAECRKYRSADFSIKEIDKIKHIDSLLQYVSILEQKQEYYKKQSLYFYKLIHKNNETLDKLHSIINHSHLISIEELEECYLFPASYDFKHFFEDKDKYLNFTSTVHEDFAFTDFSLLIKKDDFINQKTNYIGGTSFSKDMIEILNISDKHMIHVKKQKALSTIIIINEDFNINYSLFNPALQYIQDHHLVISGDIFATQIAKIHKNKNRYLKVWVPIH